MAWLSGGYSKRKPITITGGASGAQTDFQLKLAVSYAAAMQGDFDDLRFTQADGQTLIDVWLESKVDDTSAAVWAEFPTTPANTVEQTYYMYYGNSGAASDWDIVDTFVFADDFSGDLSKWTTEAGAWSISSGRLYCNATGAQALIRTSSYNSFANNILECDWEFINWQSGGREGVLIRYQDISNYYAMWLTQTGSTGGNKAVVIEDRVGGSWGSINYATQNFTTGTPYDLKYQADGTTLKAFFEDTEKVSTTRTNFSSGAIGFRSWFADIYIDNVRVRKYAANPPTYAFGSEESEPSGGHPTMRRWGGIPGMPNGTGRRSW